ncbi:MAG: hypothetical protein J6A69_11825 [Clostridia bacterium]|nr:hypothetical protein [Clostridia bacterium]
MKNKIFAVILTVCMLFSTISMTALANDAEEVEILAEEAVVEEIELASDEEIDLQASTVTAQLSGSDIDGATNVALSIKLVVTFPTALPANTDVSGITLTGGTQDVELQIEGTSKTAAFSNVKITTPVLETATTYTLNVPALGSNAEASFSFTTVPYGYIAYEDYNDRFNAYATSKQNGTQDASTGHLVDTNSDGKKDSLKIGGGNFNTLYFPTLIPLATTDETIIEVRAMYSKGGGGGSFYQQDGTFNGTGDSNNYGLIGIGGNNLGNNQGHVGVLRDGSGNLSYGKGEPNLTFDTGYKIYANTWYTFRIMLDPQGGSFRLYVFDDAGNAYVGPSQDTRWGNAWSVNNFRAIYGGYNWYVQQTTDYIHMWRNGAFKDITATYGKNLNLADAVGVPGSIFVTTLKFENDVTLQELSALRINNGATLSPSLVDSKTVALTISNLAYNKNYILDIPQFGNNKAKTFAFTTESAPVPLESGDYAFTLADGTAVTELSAVRADSTIEYVVDADLLTATPDAYKNVIFEDALGNTVEAECSLGANGKYVAYPKKGLAYGTTYTFKWPTAQKDENGKTRYKLFTFTTEAAPFSATADPIVISGSSVTASASITDNTGLNNKIKAMLVVYDGEGKIAKVTAQDMTLAAGVNSINLTATAPAAARAKLYIWGGFNGMSNIILAQ